MIAADPGCNGCQISRVERDHHRQPGCFVDTGAGSEAFHDDDDFRVRQPSENIASAPDRTVRELLLNAVSTDELQRCQFSRVTSRNDQRSDQIVLENPFLNQPGATAAASGVNSLARCGPICLRSRYG